MFIGAHFACMRVTRVTTFVHVCRPYCVLTKIPRELRGIKSFYSIPREERFATGKRSIMFSHAEN